VRKYYGLDDTQLKCVVLTSLYPDTVERRIKWAQRLGWGSPFPAVAEHIIPASQPLAEAAADIDVWSGMNAIPLLKDLECHFQAGHIAIFPTEKSNSDDTSEMKVYVSKDFRSKNVIYRERQRGEPLPHNLNVRVFGEDGRLDDLLLGNLHRKTFQMLKGPSIRALYFKAIMAHRESSRSGGGGIPNPADEPYYTHFLARCSMLGSLLTRALVHVPPSE